MNRFLLALGVLTASTLLVSVPADAQRGRGGGGFHMGGGGFGGGGFGRGGFGGGGFGRGGFQGGGFGGARIFTPRPGIGGFGGGMGGGGIRRGAIGVVPGGPGRIGGFGPGVGGFRQAAIGIPPGRIGNRGDWRYGVRPVGSWGPRYPYYGGRYPYYGRYYARYPYYGGWGWDWGLATGAIIGAAATYPYYSYPYYNGSYSPYQTPVASAIGGYCVTPARTCALINSAPVGTGCSCRVPGGRARGTVQ